MFVVSKKAVVRYCTIYWSSYHYLWFCLTDTSFQSYCRLCLTKGTVDLTRTMGFKAACLNFKTYPMSETWRSGIYSQLFIECFILVTFDVFDVSHFATAKCSFEVSDIFMVTNFFTHLNHQELQICFLDDHIRLQWLSKVTVGKVL